MTEHHEDPVDGWGGALWAAADLVTPMAIRVAATLRLADHIAAGTVRAEALAATVDADPDALRRVLAHLVRAGAFVVGDDGTFGLAALGEQLRDSDPSGVRAWIDLDGAVGRADLCLTELLHTVRTGEPAFPRHFGRSFWEDLSADPARAASFDALMSTRHTHSAQDVAAAYPWGGLGHIVDVGGGDGTLLIGILRGHPGLRGTVLDLPGPADRARRRIAAAGLADRADAVAGSFFEPLPAGAGGYVLSGILDDWGDEEALRILRRCAEAAGGSGFADSGPVGSGPAGSGPAASGPAGSGPAGSRSTGSSTVGVSRVGSTGLGSGRVLVVDHIGGSGAAIDTEGDLRMLCYVSGRERGLDTLAELAGEAGLRLGSVTPTGGPSIVELLPSG